MSKDTKEKPITAQEVLPIVTDEKGQVSPKVVNALQCVFDSLQRHALGVTKIMVDSGKNPIQQIGNNPSLLVKGFESRLGYKMTATYPSLLLKQILPEDTSKYTVSAATTLSETIIGAPLEVNSAKNSLKTLGKDISTVSAFANTTKSVFLPFLCRNYIGWLVLNSPEEDLGKKFVKGGLAGILSSPLDSIGNKVMAISDSSKSLVETYLQAAKELSIPNMVKSAPIRAIAAGSSAVILSKEMQKIVSEAIDPLYQKAQILNSVKYEDDKPENSLKPVSNGGLIQEIENTNER